MGLQPARPSTLRMIAAVARATGHIGALTRVMAALPATATFAIAVGLVFGLVNAASRARKERRDFRDGVEVVSAVGAGDRFRFRDR